MSTFIASPAIKDDSFKSNPTLLNFITKEQFTGTFNGDAAMHLHNLVEICEIKRYKEYKSNYVKLKLFLFSLRDRAKEWLLSLPTGSTNSWNKCKEAFVGKYYPPIKII